MPKKISSKKSKIIVTHGKNFHTDDVFAMATMMHVAEYKKWDVNIVRTVEPEKYKTKINEFGRAADFILDIGAEYDPKKGYFDHHQRGGAGKRKNGIMYATFGLIWKQFGKELVGSDFAFDWIDRHMVQAVDAMDNGFYVYTPLLPDVHPFIISECIKAFSDVAKENEYDSEFMKVAKAAYEILRVFMLKVKEKEKFQKIGSEIYKKAKDKRIMITDEYIPVEFDNFKTSSKDKGKIQPLVHVYPDPRGNWAAKVITKGGQTYDSYMKFPEKWRGKRDADMAKASGVADAVFCHNSGFLAVAKTKEGALKLVEIALS